MSRNKEYEHLKYYFAEAMDMNSIPVKKTKNFGKLHGTWLQIRSNNLNDLKNES